MATIGRNAAVADLSWLRVSGFAAWVLWLTIHIFWLIGFRNRLTVLVQWAGAYLTYQRSVRLITGAARAADPVATGASFLGAALATGPIAIQPDRRIPINLINPVWTGRMLSDVQSRVGPYRIVERLGAGGMGIVYLAEDPRLGRRVALKRVSDPALSTPDARAHLLREAAMAATLNHPNIATVYDVLEEEGRPYIVMEYVPGETLSSQLSTGPLAIDRVVQIGLQLCDALGEAHAHGVVHRDLKPANIRITPGGRVKVLDFGLALRPQVDRRRRRSGGARRRPVDRRRGARRRAWPDARPDCRHAHLHGAGGAARPVSRRARGHLRAGRDAVRARDRTRAVWRAQLRQRRGGRAHRAAASGGRADSGWLGRDHRPRDGARTVRPVSDDHADAARAGVAVGEAHRHADGSGAVVRPARSDAGLRCRDAGR